MDFADKIAALAQRIAKQKDAIETEEATKTAFIMPFLRDLGYDVFDPHVVVPEFIADVGVKKGEKVDYAIKLDGKVVNRGLGPASNQTLFPNPSFQEIG